MINTKDLIGRHKYNALSRFDFDNMTTNELVQFRNEFNISVSKAQQQMKDYEKYHKPTPEQTEESIAYFKSLENIAKPEQMKITKKSLWNSFLRNFKIINKTDFTENEEVIENLKPIFYYFTHDLESFKKCKRVSQLSKPSLEKGLLIVGDFGNGKTSAMKTLEKSLRNTHKSFKGFTTNDCVKIYEGSKTSEDAEHFFNDLCSGRRYFDDLKTERQVVYYGRKFHLFKDVLETRDSKNLITHATINYKKGFEGDLKEAIAEIGEIYGDRVNDRIYRMFNILEFKGKSFRI